MIINPNSAILKITATSLLVGSLSACLVNPEAVESSITEAEITCALGDFDCSEKRMGKRPVKNWKMSLPIYFGNNSWEIQSSSYSALSALGISFQHGLANATVELRGYADNQGDDNYNRQLSQRRADMVRDYLISTYGIDGNRLIARGYGELPSRSAKNRRVEAIRIR